MNRMARYISFNTDLFDRIVLILHKILIFLIYLMIYMYNCVSLSYKRAHTKMYTQIHIMHAPPHVHPQPLIHIYNTLYQHRSARDYI